jgi:hypothetical protein
MGISLVTGTVDIRIDATLRNTTADSVNVDDKLIAQAADKKTYANGTAAGQANLVFHTQRTLLTTTDETLDLRALTDTEGTVFGTYQFSKVRAILVELVTATTGYRLEVGAASANQFVGPIKDTSDIAVVPASGRWFAESPVDGWTVDATHKDLKISNPSGGSAVYKIKIIGVGTVS